MTEPKNTPSPVRSAPSAGPLTDEHVARLVLLAASEPTDLLGPAPQFCAPALPDAFWSKVSPDEFGCWRWTGSHPGDGYGLYWHGGKSRRAHRIPPGLELDHLCKVRNCVNPLHLEAVPHRVNVRRSPNQNAGKTHCDRGHEFTPENTRHYRRSDGGMARACRACTREHQRRWLKRSRAASVRVCRGCGRRGRTYPASRYGGGRVYQSAICVPCAVAALDGADARWSDDDLRRIHEQALSPCDLAADATDLADSIRGDR